MPKLPNVIDAFILDLQAEEAHEVLIWLACDAHASANFASRLADVHSLPTFHVAPDAPDTPGPAETTTAQANALGRFLSRKETLARLEKKELLSRTDDGGGWFEFFDRTRVSRKVIDAFIADSVLAAPDTPRGVFIVLIDLP